MAETENKEMDETIVNEALQFLDGAAPFIMEQGFAPHVYSNDPYNPAPYGLLDLFYRNTYANRLGMTVSKDNETGDSQLLLCFVGDKGEDGVELFPIAALLKEEDLTRYSSPDGQGGYFEQQPE